MHSPTPSGLTGTGVVSEGLIYRPLEAVTFAEARRILREGSAEERLLLPLRVGDLLPDPRKAVAICVRLLSDLDPRIRANAVLGLSYAVRRQRFLDRDTVRPLLLRELAENRDFSGRIADALEDINLFMGWRLAEDRIARIRSGLDPFPKRQGAGSQEELSFLEGADHVPAPECEPEIRESTHL